MEFYLKSKNVNQINLPQNILKNINNQLALTPSTFVNHKFTSFSDAEIVVDYYEGTLSIELYNNNTRFDDLFDLANLIKDSLVIDDINFELLLIAKGDFVFDKSFGYLIKFDVDSYKIFDLESVMNVPVGSIQEFVGSSIPFGWFECDGRELSVKLYPKLFNVIGNSFGGDGVNTFNLPNISDVSYATGFNGDISYENVKLATIKHIIKYF